MAPGGAEIAVAAGVEVAKMLLMLYLEQARKAGLTEAQIRELLITELAKFNAKDPGAIADPN